MVCQFVAFSPEQVQRDLKTFRNRTGQYVFISSASAYRKPVTDFTITERVPLQNPFWEYSRLKAACEQVLQQQTDVPYTIVRPSHTTRTRLPTALSEGDQLASRMPRGLPVVVPGDGTALWPLTRSEDFAVPFVRLFGNAAALWEDFHITTDHAFTWNDIYRAIGRGVGASAELAHVATDTLVRYQPDEPRRVYRRLRSLRGLSLWSDKRNGRRRSGIRLRFESGRFGWSWNMGTIMPRNGR